MAFRWRSSWPRRACASSRWPSWPPVWTTASPCSGVRSTTTPERHQTLEVALAWSYDLLDPAEQQLFRFLSAFPDEAPLAAVEAMAARLDIDALTVLEGLIERSLVTTVRSGPQYRYRLLGSLRDYGRIRLAERGEVDLASGAMRDWVMALVADLERDMRTPRQDDALRAVLPELATARAAYEWTLQQGDPLTALRMLSAVPLMPTGQRFAELGRLLAAIPDAPPALVAQGQLTLANLAGEVGDAEVGVEQAAAAASAFDELGDRRLGAWARYFGAMVAWTGGEERAEVATGLRAALAMFEALDDQLGLAYVLWPLSLLDGGAQARDAAERSADLFRRQGSPFGLAHALEGRALVGLVEDRPAEAIAPLEEALTLLAALGNRGCVAHALEAAAAVVAGRGGRLDAARLMGAAASLRSEVGQDHRPWGTGGSAPHGGGIARRRSGPGRRRPGDCRRPGPDACRGRRPGPRCARPVPGRAGDDGMGLRGPRPERTRGRGARAARRRGDQPGDRRTAVPVAEDRRAAPQQPLPEAGSGQPDPGGGRGALARRARERTEGPPPPISTFSVRLAQRREI